MTPETQRALVEALRELQVFGAVMLDMIPIADETDRRDYNKGLAALVNSKVALARAEKEGTP